jgi:hypothetical protein
MPCILDTDHYDAVTLTDNTPTDHTENMRKQQKVKI